MKSLAACILLMLLFTFSNQATAEDAIALKSGSKFVRTITFETGKKDEEPKEATRTFTVDEVGQIGESGRAAIRGTFDFAYPGKAKGEFFGYYETTGNQRIELLAIGVDESPQKFTSPRVSGFLKMADAPASDAESAGDDESAGSEDDDKDAEAKPVVVLNIFDSQGNSAENSAEYEIQ